MQVSCSFRSGTAEFDPLASQKQFLGSPKCPQRGPGSQNEKPPPRPQGLDPEVEIPGLQSSGERFAAHPFRF